jgi:hypothetical protein
MGMSRLYSHSNRCSFGEERLEQARNDLIYRFQTASDLRIWMSQAAGGILPQARSLIVIPKAHMSNPPIVCTFTMQTPELKNS